MDVYLDVRYFDFCLVLNYNISFYCFPRVALSNLSSGIPFS